MATTITATAPTDVRSISPIGHDEAMSLADTEARRLLEVVDQLCEPDWSLPTECAGWDVKALLSHVLGSMERDTRFPVFVGQFVAAQRATKRTARPMIDEMTARHVREHAHLSPSDLTRRMHELALRAVAGRRRRPALLRAMKMKASPPFEGTWTFGYLVDIILGRDNWMHRVDLCRAMRNPLVLTADHDGRIMADVIADWARAHRQPFRLTLEGPAGGSFAQGTGGDELRLDAVEFCRILSGRGDGSGLLTHPIPF